MRTKLALVFLLLVSSFLADGIFKRVAQAQSQPNKFFCGLFQEKPATIARTPQGVVPIIVWTKSLDNGLYNPLTRCRQVSARFENFYRNSLLRYITSGRSNGQNIICVAAVMGGKCLRDGLLFTLRPNDTPRSTLIALFNISTGRASSIFYQSADSRFPGSGSMVTDAD